ncbi:putative FAD-linked oxidoreductase [Thalassovita gelatinovora]|uniref:Putative FAD-linked oxidoreductase n=1 Tax=Thalassovita gelatinovora TaxID=53501 RepID=A0A0P1F892_THAGE|nr:FAD-binding oxidoreductase [Thalassovita gelatinovora]QIZ80294.1 FAD-binding oxidoreductase [Thalassovita gelatinovora]CUH64192.1 putative FAD-linked oxidoreductase [Thalassovita gelatinovora]SEQ85230.1 FAD/FMN-containing dehydrogenase [Thalassovita gelatinovora]
MNLNPVTPAFLETLQSVLPDRCLRPADPRYLEEPRGRWKGQAGAIVAPDSTEQVAAVLKAANAARVPVVPYGGGTGLVGGQIMADGPAPLLLSLERMTKIRALYPEENVMVADAGAILQDIHEAALAADRLFPMSIAAKGSARIGGCLATNAGGVNVLRYGNTRDLALGLEAVLPDGRIWNGLTRLRKDNTGYDLRDLLIGSEGTLGVITAAALKLAPRPAGEGTALIVVDSPAAALTLLSLARDHMGEGVSAFELIHGTGLEFLAEKLPQLRQPFAEAPEWMVLIDVGLARGIDPATALENLFVAGLEAGLVSDGLIAQSQQQRQDFWEIREQIPEANRLVGSISSHDISLPLSTIADFITKGGDILRRMGDFRINCFGHLGDGNLHYNVFPAKGRQKSDYLDQRDAVQRAVHDLVDEFDGSFSAEHGVGRLKVADLERYGDPVKLQMMRSIKTAFDPNGILNPGAVLRA